MKGRAHFVLSSALAAATLTAAGAPATSDTAARVLLCGLGSLLPDVDSPHSTVCALVPPLRLVARFALTHRGRCHSLAAVLVVYAVAFLLIGHAWALPLAAGYALHLLEDCWTPAGLPALLWPLVRRWRAHAKAA